MRIRIPFASKKLDNRTTLPSKQRLAVLTVVFVTGAFLILLLGSAYVGLTSFQIPGINDKALHFVTFFLLTLSFYWIVEGTRRRALNFSLVICTAVLGVGSEILQGLLPNGRIFDPLDIVANIAGSLAALGICSWYHKRMLDRKRQRKYTAVPGDEDLELGEGASSRQESGVTDGPSLEEEVDNWDENMEDNWEEDEAHVTNGDDIVKTPQSSSAEGEGEGRTHD